MSKKATEAIKTLRENIGFEKIKNAKLKEILREKINKIEFKEVKDSILGILYMVCEFSYGDDILSRGVTVRSLLDNFNKKKGKNKAFGRAVKALLNETNTYPIRDNIHIGEPVNRSLTIIDDDTVSEFSHLLNVIVKFKQDGNKIYYKIDPSLPLQIAKESGIRFKSEYRPSKLYFKGI